MMFSSPVNYIFINDDAAKDATGVRNVALNRSVFAWREFPSFIQYAIGSIDFTEIVQ
ncbi:hypothetical protein BN131_997 [Cronobacter malonaticus 681]|nr:hypothetical protein BN131_997 [Cronobacter malonaticus 681]